jgi:hypothetical protein
MDVSVGVPGYFRVGLLWTALELAGEKNFVMVGCFASWGCVVVGRDSNSFGVGWGGAAIAWVMCSILPHAMPSIPARKGPGRERCHRTYWRGKSGFGHIDSRLPGKLAMCCAR